MIQHSERRRQMELDLRTLGLEIEVVLAAEGSRYVGMRVDEIEQAAQSSFFIVAIEHAGSGKIDRPMPDTVLRAGDGVTLLGRGGRADIVSHFGAG